MLGNSAIGKAPTEALVTKIMANINVSSIRECYGAFIWLTKHSLALRIENSSLVKKSYKGTWRKRWAWCYHSLEDTHPLTHTLPSWIGMTSNSSGQEEQNGECASSFVHFLCVPHDDAMTNTICYATSFSQEQDLMKLPHDTKENPKKHRALPSVYEAWDSAEGTKPPSRASCRCTKQAWGDKEGIRESDWWMWAKRSVDKIDISKFRTKTSCEIDE